MKKILVPCDFSNPADNAFRFAIDLATKANAIIHIINVIELPILYDTVMMPVLDFEAAFLKELREKTERQFKKIKDKYKSEGIKIVSSVEFGPTSKTILAYAKTHAIDFIVMGSHGSSGLREFVIGSNAEKIVRRSPIPVFVIKNYSKSVIKNIVFPNSLDTVNQEDLMMKVEELQDFFKAKLHIVFINTPLNFTAGDVIYERLTAFADRYMLKNYTLNVYNHPDGEEGIEQFTEKINGDLIALGTHGRKGIAHFIHRSLAEDVANHSPKLIWTYSLENEPVEV